VDRGTDRCPSGEYVRKYQTFFPDNCRGKRVKSCLYRAMFASIGNILDTDRFEGCLNRCGVTT